MLNMLPNSIIIVNKFEISLHNNYQLVSKFLTKQCTNLNTMQRQLMINCQWIHANRWPGWITRTQYTSMHLVVRRRYLLLQMRSAVGTPPWLPHWSTSHRHKRWRTCCWYKLPLGPCRDYSHLQVEPHRRCSWIRQLQIDKVKVDSIKYMVW